MKWRPRSLCVLAFLAMAGATLSAQIPAYLNEMPSVDRVVSDMRTGSTRESAVRASLALRQLASIVRVLSGESAKRTPLPAAAAKSAEYQQRSDELFRAEEIKAGPRCTVDDEDCESALFYRCSSSYVFSSAFDRELLDRYFSAQWQAQYVRRFASVSGDLWRQALALPVGTKAVLSPAEAQNCADVSARSSLASGNLLRSPLNFGRSLVALIVTAGSIGASAVVALAFPAAIVAWVGYRVKNMRYFAVRRSNREAIQVFGAGDRTAREQAIIDAFDSTDHTFRYSGVNRTSGHKMRFVLLRSIKSFRRGDLEALRFAYLAFNRALLDEEKFHWYRFSAIYGGGVTDPSEWKFLGLFALLKSRRAAIDQARASVTNYASVNGGEDLESQALATIQKLALEHPDDHLYRDMQRRFVEGLYWLTKGELKRSAFGPSDSPFGVSFGLLDGTDTDLVFAGDGSIMTIAPPGSGKTQCSVLPNLLRWPGPAVVLDVKGEIYDATSRWRAAHVGPVIKFSPLDPARSACYNPLSGVRTESFFLWEDARFLASMMIVPVAKEPFWEDKAREILTAIIADVSFWNPPDDRPLSKVLSLVNRNGWAEFVDRMRKNPELSTMRDEGSNLAQMDAKTLDGALQTAKASLSAWVGERIAHVTRRSDWNPLDLRNGTNPTIYVCVKPNEIDAYLSLLRVVIAQHIRALTSTDLPPRGTAPILFVLDELPRLKHMPPVEEALEVGRGYGIKLWMFAQSLGQMRNAYPNADGMIGSCAVRSFMNPSLQDGTAKMVAEQIGYRTGEEHGGKDKRSNANPNTVLVVQPTELAGVEFKELQIVMGVGSKPAKVRKMYAHQDAALKAKMGTVQQEVRGEPAIT